MGSVTIYRLGGLTFVSRVAEWRSRAMLTLIPPGNSTDGVIPVVAADRRGSGTVGSPHVAGACLFASSRRTHSVHKEFSCPHHVSTKAAFWAPVECRCFARGPSSRRRWGRGAFVLQPGMARHMGCATCHFVDEAAKIGRPLTVERLAVPIGGNRGTSRWSSYVWAGTSFPCGTGCS